MLDEVGLDARATKDLDIVLCIEAMDAEFGRVVWEFIRNGQYQIQEKSDGHKVLYRFKNPSQVGYPVMLELFSHKPDVLVSKLSFFILFSQLCELWIWHVQIVVGDKLKRCLGSNTAFRSKSSLWLATKVSSKVGR